jgi:hypothetical protein
VSRADTVVQILERGCLRAQVEDVADEGAAARTHARCETPIGHDCFERVGDGEVISLGDDETSFTVDHGFRHAAVSRRDDRYPGGAGLVEHESQRFLLAVLRGLTRQRNDRGARHQLADLVVR